MATVVIAVVVGFLSLLLILKRVLLPSQRLPPGPRPLPILGNILLMRNNVSMANLANELALTYGPIITLWIGSKPLVIISGTEILQEALIRQGNLFMRRANLVSRAIVENNYRGVTTGAGERHKFFRKLAVSEVLTNRRVAGYRPIRDRESDILIKMLKKKALDNAGCVSDFRVTIRWAVTNILMSICLGERLDLQQYLNLDYLLVERFKMAPGKPRDYVPFLQLFPDSRRTEDQMDMTKKMDDFFMPMIEERRKMFPSGTIPENSTFVDTLLALQGQPIVKGGLETIDITDRDIVFLCFEILHGGIDTTALNTEFAIANLINHPEIQEKLFDEISSVVGEKVVNEDDIPKLPYLQAVLQETLRRHTPTRLSPSRVSSSPTKLGGYDIPANCTVIQNLESVALNSKIWENPLEFNPDRFLEKNVDITGGSGEITMIPFGLGRRICPGINIALLHGHLLLARLVQTFEWKSTTPGQLLDLSPDSGFLGLMKYPLKPVLRARTGAPDFEC